MSNVHKVKGKIAEQHIAIAARPAVQRAYAIAKEVNPQPQAPTGAEERKVLFGQDRTTVR